MGLLVDVILIFSSGEWFINGSISRSGLNNQFILIVYYRSLELCLSYACLLFERGINVTAFSFLRGCVYFAYLMFLLSPFCACTVASSRKWDTVKTKASAVAFGPFLDIYFPFLGSKPRLIVLQLRELYTLIKSKAEFAPFIQMNVKSDTCKMTPVDTFKLSRNTQGRTFLNLIPPRCCLIQGFAATQEMATHCSVKMTYRLEERSYFTARS